MADIPNDEIRGVKVLDEVAAQAAQNRTYRRALLDNPKQVLTEAGLKVPRDAQVIVHVNTPEVIHLVLPGPPEKVSLREVNLAKFSPCMHF
jgi:hypothetical protein